FLFNSLNSIMALIDLQPEKAQEMIVSLSAFLRGTLRVDPLQSSSFREEMQQLERYLEIEKVRYGHRLEVKKSLTDAALTAHLSNMILQPLLENAIKFSLYNHSGSVSINLQAFVDEHDQLCLSIQNPYKPEGETRQRGTGFGIRGVKRRLFLLF